MHGHWYSNFCKQAPAAPFADDLLNPAHHLAARGGKSPWQSSLRRSASTDFVLNWKAKDQSARLGRMFEHGKMIQAPFKPKGGTPTPAESSLKAVIDAFVQLQKDRHIGDYDVGFFWSRVDCRTGASPDGLH